MGFDINNKPNLTDNSKPDETSIFVWIDILGFSKIVENGDEYSRLMDILIDFQNKFDFSNHYRTRVISDGMLLEISESNHNFNLKKCINILKEIGKKQFEFIISINEFIRGGIAVGSSIEYRIKSKAGNESENRNIISNGLARSYNLESTGIGWPIIGVNKVYLKQLQDLFMFNDEYFELSHTFNHKGEDLYFIDYCDFIEDQEEHYNEILLRKIYEFENEPPIRNKYIWLLKHLTKHNKCLIPENYKKSIL